MQKVLINTAKIHISRDSTIFDTGELPRVDISIDENIIVQYCFVPASAGIFVRHVDIATLSQFTGTAIIVHGGTELNIVTNVVGDNVKSNLALLVIAKESSTITVEGVARVDAPYRQVSTRVDQTNILLGKDTRVKAMPRLEIATDDIEGGHSCKVHRLGGDASFYLESRGLSKKHAEALLLNSEILKHLAPLEDDEEKRKVCFDIHKKLTDTAE